MGLFGAIKPCPFCGGEPKDKMYNAYDGIAFELYCPKCGVSIREIYKEEDHRPTFSDIRTAMMAAEDKWNRRAEDKKETPDPSTVEIGDIVVKKNDRVVLDIGFIYDAEGGYAIEVASPSGGKYVGAANDDWYKTKYNISYQQWCDLSHYMTMAEFYEYWRDKIPVSEVGGKIEFGTRF